MILARLLAPDAYGVMAMAMIVISFAELFTDAGFQKYLIQHEFATEEDKYKSTTVAFWSNFVLSMTIWAVIVIFSDQIATQVGSPGYGLVISVSCVCIPLAAFSSIQMALYKRHFDFKTLFLVRIIGIAVPLLVTVPIAYFYRSYWALIIGMIVKNMINAIILTWKSPWKPHFYYSWKRLKQMFSFTMWTMVEQISIWATSYADLFIVGVILNQHYLGLYRVSMSTVGQFMGIITAATTPVLFSSLSRLQGDDEAFKRMFYKFQKLVGLLIIPMGVGIFLFSDLITAILLGDKWGDASFFIGVWALSSTIMIVLSHYCSEVYRAKGKPKISFWVQISHIAFLIPTLMWAIHYSFDFLCTARAIVRLQLMVANLICVYFLMKMTPLDMLKQLFPAILGATAMAAVVILLPEPPSMWIKATYLLLAVVVYLSVIMLFKTDRSILLNIKHLLKR